jgi:hypothetical protein
MPYIKSYKCSFERIPYSEEKAACALLDLTKELNATTICHLNDSVHSVLYVFQQGSLYYSGLDNWTMSSHEYRDTSRPGWDPGVKGSTVLFWFGLRTDHWTLNLTRLSTGFQAIQTVSSEGSTQEKKYLRPAISSNSRVRVLHAFFHANWSNIVAEQR